MFGPVGSGVREHVNEYIGQHVHQHMKKQIDDYVTADMSGGTVAAVVPDTQEQGHKAAAELIARLRSPEGMRQAILVNEILSRPRSLRR